VCVPAASNEAKAIPETPQAIIRTATTALKIVKDTSKHEMTVGFSDMSGTEASDSGGNATITHCECL
jgi:hypothetical protein